MESSGLSEKLPSAQSADDGVEKEDTYGAARSVLAQAKEEAFAKWSAEKRKRILVSAAVIVVWLAVSVYLVTMVNPDALVGAEISLVAVLAFVVFYLIPAFMGKDELNVMFDQYGDQLDKLESAGAKLPYCRSIEELVPAIDYASIQIEGTEGK